MILRNVCLSREIMLVPVFLPNCGHTICDLCATTIKNKHNEADNRHCPECRATLPILLETFQQNLLIKRRVQQLEAQCPSCSMKAALSIILQHCCPEQRVQCDNEGCELTMRRRDKQEHNEVCPRTFITCNQCSVAVARESINKHLEDECRKRETKCPLGCKSVVTR